ncbi:MAG: sigma-54-dependent Fis family transcriptional regulator [Deltaproteobacteria bacterium]|nr:sigma-54-dependent Fis family transcriptional regulator [Deltaproteobacteria bacterium]
MAHIIGKMGHEVVCAENGEKGLELLNNTSFDLVITDLKLPGVDGMEIVKSVRELQLFTEVIVVTGYATVDTAVEAMKSGAYHYIAKPYKIDPVRKLVSEALMKRRLLLENRELRQKLSSPGGVPYIIGKSPAMNRVHKRIRQIAVSDANILLLGESGTGKELAARAIHDLSGRRANHFMAFNCGSFTEELMANELFGHEKGAYTGATSRKSGLIETADKGTVFLDEIGDMPLSMQVKLLRVIQEKEVMRVGGTAPISVDVRFIAATHRDLEADVKKGHFRQDFFYRLNVISIHLPPLAEREGDIPLLAHHFLRIKSEAAKKEIAVIETSAMSLLKQYDWPGNVRELENVIERAVALETGDSISSGVLPDYMRNLSIQTYRKSGSAIPSLEEQELDYIRWVLEQCGGNKTKAAKIIGIDRVSLWRKIKKYGLEGP